MGGFLYFFVLVPPSFPPVFGCSPINSNTHHDMLGIVQEMPLGRTFLSGITFLFILFIHTSSSCTHLEPREQTDHLSATFPVKCC